MMNQGKDQTSVVRIRMKGGQVIQDCDIYIGRAVNRGGWDLPWSKWANPFTLNSCKSIDEAISKYRDYVLASPRLMNDLEELQGKRLGCFCEQPGPCHGHVLIELLNKKKK